MSFIYTCGESPKNIFIPLGFEKFYFPSCLFLISEDKNETSGTNGLRYKYAGIKVHLCHLSE